MELFIGGAFQGKLDYVKSLYNGRKVKVFSEDDFNTLCTLKDEEVIWNHFHLTVRNLLKAGFEPEEVTGRVEEIISKNPDIRIISTEIGCGVVPVKEEDRIWRDYTGHLLVKIARNAGKVERIICGIPQRLK